MLTKAEFYVVRVWCPWLAQLSLFPMKIHMFYVMLVIGFGCMLNIKYCLFFRKILGTTFKSLKPRIEYEAGELSKYEVYQNNN